MPTLSNDVVKVKVKKSCVSTMGLPPLATPVRSPSTSSKMLVTVTGSVSAGLVLVMVYVYVAAAFVDVGDGLVHGDAGSDVGHGQRMARGVTDRVLPSSSASTVTVLVIRPTLCGVVTA